MKPMVRVERLVEASPEAVWKLWTDVEGSPRWDQDVAWSRLGGAFEAGTAGEFKLKRGPRVLFELIEVTPHRSYSNVAWFAPGLRVVFDHELTPVGPLATQVVHSARFAGRLGKVLAPVLRRPIEQALQRALDQLASLARQHRT